MLKSGAVKTHGFALGTDLPCMIRTFNHDIRARVITKGNKQTLAHVFVIKMRRTGDIPINVNGVEIKALWSGLGYHLTNTNKLVINGGKLNAAIEMLKQKRNTSLKGRYSYLVIPIL